MKNQSSSARAIEETSWSAGHSVHIDSAVRLNSSALARISMPSDSGPRILAVDDDPGFLRILGRAAEMKGATVTWCQTFAEFRALKNAKYDAVVMDYDMGDVNGFEMTTYLEDTTMNKLPVILVSNTDRANSAIWLESIREFVHKRFGPFAIVDAVYAAHELTTIYNLLSE